MKIDIGGAVIPFGARILTIVERIRSGFWFVPAVLVVLSLLVAFGMVALDNHIPQGWLQERGWVYTRSAEGAGTILGTIAGSMITIAGVVFSLTLVALTLASSQYGPRLLRNFMRDTVNQAVIGVFIATFLYCLIVLRAIRKDGDTDFVPHLSVSFAVVLAVLSTGVLIYFIHHVAVSIQADDVVARVNAELDSSIERLFPEQIGGGAAPRERTGTPRLPEYFERDARAVTSPDDGYVQVIDPDGLMKLAREHDAVIRLEYGPGRYVTAGSALAYVHPGDRADDGFAKALRSAFALDMRRSPAQDIGFSIDQLVEIAVRALSPGINDPFTAITCVDRLGSALARLARRQMPSPYRRDEGGALRVVAPAVTFPDLADAALNQIRQAARGNAAVTIRLLDAIGRVAEGVTRPEDREALRRHAERIARGAQDAIPDAGDRKDVDERAAAALRRLGH